MSVSGHRKDNDIIVSLILTLKTDPNLHTNPNPNPIYPTD